MDANSGDIAAKGGILRLQFSRFKWLKNLVEEIADQFSLPLGAWKISREIVVSILISSLLINILLLVFPLTLLQIYDRIIPNQSLDTLFWLTVIVFFSLILSGILQVTRSCVGAWADAKMEHIIGCKAFERLMNCRINVYEKQGSGQYLKRMSALASLKNFYAGQLVIAMVDLPFVLLFILLIFYIGGWLVLIPLSVAMLMMFFLLKNSKVMKYLLETRQDNDDRRLNFLVETLSKIHTIKSNSMEAQMMRRYEQLQRKTVLFDYKMNQCSSFLLSDSMTFSQLTIVLVAAFGSVLVFNGYITVGVLAACTLLSGRCLQPINSLMTVWSRMQAVRVAKQELEKILTMHAESGDSLPQIKKLAGKIDIDAMSFRYSRDTPLIFDRFSLHMNPNECISINSEGFSGKSTLCYFLMGFIRPSSGRILIDDRDIFTLNLESLRKHIGYMPENAMLFRGTILENLSMFDSSLEDNAIRAVKNMEFNDAIEHLPDGFDTMMGYQSTDILSRGMMQRLAMARALVRNPRIILFDEADVTLDHQSDEKIKNFLERIIGKYTLIIISHRSSILSLAPKRYRVEQGRLRLLS